MSQIFRVQDIPCDLWVDIAIRFLTGDTTQWWNRIKNRIYGQRWRLFTFLIRGAFRTLREVSNVEKDYESIRHMDSNQGSNF